MRCFEGWSCQGLPFGLCSIFPVSPPDVDEACIQFRITGGWSIPPFFGWPSVICYPWTYRSVLFWQAVHQCKTFLKTDSSGLRETPDGTHTSAGCHWGKNPFAHHRYEYPGDSRCTSFSNRLFLLSIFQTWHWIIAIRLSKELRTNIKDKPFVFFRLMLYIA